jgi:uncharacterized protein YjbI with pentapeptide repeats
MLLQVFSKAKKFLTNNSKPIKITTIGGAILVSLELLANSATFADFTFKILSKSELDKCWSIIQSSNSQKIAGLTLRCLEKLNEAGETRFRRIDLKGYDLAEIKLKGADLSEANMAQTILTHANLSLTKLRAINLTSADLTSANLSGADLSQANLSNANLTNANLEGADLSETNLSNVNLSGANLKGAILRESILESANLSGANLKGAILVRANLRKANLSDRVIFVSSNELYPSYKKVELSDANLSGVDFSYAKLDGVDLSKILLEEVFESEITLRGASLNGANLHDLDLSGVNLSQAKLSGANLNKAKLIESELLHTVLIEANLLGANLSKAKTQEVISYAARFGSTQTLPEFCKTNPYFKEIKISGKSSSPCATIFPDGKTSNETVFDMKRFKKVENNILVYSDNILCADDVTNNNLCFISKKID